MGRQQWLPGTVGTGGKTPFEDFLFLLVLSLTVAVSYFSKKQLAERFVTAQSRQTSEALPTEIVKSLRLLKLPEEGGFSLNGIEFVDRAQLLHHLKESYADRQPQSVDGIRILVAYNRPWGEVEELQDLIAEMRIDTYVEKETRK